MDNSLSCNERFHLKGKVLLLGNVVAVLLLAACSSTTPAEKEPHGTKLFYIQIQASHEGVSIETNNVFAGKAPFTLGVLGNKGGTFHNFGSLEYVVRAVPAVTNGSWPTQAFKTGDGSTPGDRIPGMIFFDMDRPSASFSVDTLPED